MLLLHVRLPLRSRLPFSRLSSDRLMPGAPDWDETFGERLQRLRIARRLNLTQLAHAVDITEGAVREREPGQTKRPSSWSACGSRTCSRSTRGTTPPAGSVPFRSEREPSIVNRLTTLEQRVDVLEAERRAV
jgi:hypothetical protein